MERFIVSARKYRPKNFDSLIGQENIATTLKNSILRGQLAHAYLFCGPRGVGKTSAARIFAKSINCLNPSPDMEPCGVCESCQSFNEGRSFCIHELDAASNNSVDDIRNLTELVRIPPQIGKYSVYIIDEVHMLSAAAFNAFLKTLEEPPAYAIFILATTEKHKILPTILSRCQTYDFNRISIEGIMQNIRKIAQEEDIHIEDDALHIIAQKADGAMRDALTLFDQTVAFCGRDIRYSEVIKNLNVLDYEYYFRLCEAFLKKDHTSALLIFDEVLSKGFNALHFISGLNTHFRDLIVCKNQASRTLMSLPPSLIQRYEELSGRMSVHFLFKAIEICTDCEAAYRQSGNQRLLIEFSLMKICFLEGLPQEPQTLTTPAAIPSSAPVAVPAPAAASAPEVQKAPEPQKAPDPNPVTRPEGTLPPEAIPSEEKDPVSEPEPVPVKAAAPKPQPVPETASAPETPVSEKSKLPLGGMSLKAMLRKAQNVVTHENEAQEISDAETPFDIERAKSVWSEMAQEEAVKHKALAMAMQQYPLELSGTMLTFHVSNSAQKAWIENKCQLRLIHTLRQKLNNRKADLKIEVSEQTEEKAETKLYMPSQKAKYLEHKSEELREFVKTLDLDTN